MSHRKVVRDLAAAHSANPEWFNSPESRTREALDWALENTPLNVPEMFRSAESWTWDSEDVALYAGTDGGGFRFHVASERRAMGRTRIAVMSWEDDDGSATWEAEMPAENAS